MDSIWLLLSLLLIILLINVINTTNLRCHEDINGSRQLVENCRACVIFIDTKISLTIPIKKTFVHDQSSIQELFLYNEEKHHRHRHRRNIGAIIRQKCAREIDGPLYGFDQTHCYCNSNQCNSNIQRCIYEIMSKRYFSCYYGSNSSHYSLEISKKCRSCRIRIGSNLTYHYECLAFGEQEQKNHTHCTCQQPMCNQDFAVCQRFQQIPSRPRVNSIHTIFLNSTQNISASTITSLIINSTKNLTIFSSTKQTEEEISTENSTLIELTSSSSSNETNTVIIEMKNHANYFSSNFYWILSFFFSFYI